MDCALRISTKGILNFPNLTKTIRDHSVKCLIVALAMHMFLVLGHPVSNMY